MLLKNKQIFLDFNSTVKYIATFLIGAFFSFVSYKVYLSCGANFSSMFFYREALVMVFCAFAAMNVFIKYNVLYNFIFKYRYPIAFIVLIMLVISKIHFSSIGMYNTYVQPGSGSEFVNPVFGTPRAIRSDEWAVSTPRSLTYQYCMGEKYNDIIMATQTPNISTSGVALSLSMLTRPFKIGFLFLGVEYALSFNWCSLVVVGLLTGIEFFLIITNGKKLLSFCGSVMVLFSSFAMWWSWNAVMIYAIAAIAAICKFLKTESFKKRIICGIGVIVFGSSFVGTLYPAWQVPAGYVALAVIIWGFVVNWNNIKKFKAADWIVFAATVVISLIVIIVFYIENLEYTNAVMGTVYPGSRREYGNYVLDRLFTYPATLLFPFKEGTFAFSEYGMFFSMFPLPIFVALFALFKSKKKDLLLILLLAVSAIFTIYCTVGVPKWFGDISLLSFSTGVRVLTYLDFIQIPILFRAIAIMSENQNFVPKFVIIPIAAALSIFTVYWCDKKFVYPNFMSTAYMIVISIVIFVIMTLLVGKFSERIRKIAIVMLIVIHCGVSLFVLPIQKGLDVIYSKPIAKAVMNIVDKDPDSIWIATDQWVEANFYASCGAKVINSNNYIPNYKLWKKLDPDGKYDEVYNRYANFIITMTEDESEVILNQPDLITLRLNYNQLDDINVNYMITRNELVMPENCDVSCEQLYAENGLYIYSLSY